MVSTEPLSDDPGDIYDRALEHGHALLAEVSLGGFNDLLPQPVVLKDVEKAQDHNPILVPV